MSGVHVVFVTAPDQEVAERLARTLVEERLAACVNILPPMKSVYRWEGKMEEAAEILLVIKTVNERLVTLFSRIKELHPYKVPEAIALPVDAGLPAYVQWVLAETEHIVL